MLVKVYRYAHDGAEEVYEGQCDLAEALEPDNPEYEIARNELRSAGRYWTGGGAGAPLILLKRID